MFDKLQALSQRFLALKNRPYNRYFIDSTPLKHRCLILLGQRGIGKTTTLVQYLLAHSQGDMTAPSIFYVPTDHFLLRDTSLYELAEKFHRQGGEMIAFDEIHKYPNWSQELKSIYDTFPNLIILASGSSALAIHKGSHDLSRRAIIHRLHGLSFREFLGLQTENKFSPYSLTEILENHTKLSHSIQSTLEKQKLKILPFFKTYLANGFYPYFLEIEDLTEYWLTIEQNIHITIESDLATIYPQLTGTSIKKIKQLLKFIASAVPFTPNWASIKKIIGVSDDRTLKNYFQYLEDAALIQHIERASNKLSKLEIPEKIYLNNPNQIQALSAGNGNIGNIRETFFLNMLTPHHDISLPPKGDFLIDGTVTIEVGGRNKDYSQLKTLKNAYIASDDLEVGTGKRIPLWLFGFLY